MRQLCPNHLDIFKRFPVKHSISSVSSCVKQCRQRQHFGYANSVDKVAGNAKPYYITTPIFYVNAAPHVGHMYTMVLADVMKRWQVLKEKPAVLCTGTDEHGLKIQKAAEKAGSYPQPFCDGGAELFKNLAARINISYDHFVRTTDQSHKEAVQYAWMILEDRGYIYKAKHEGWYSISDEAFYGDSGVHVVLDPRTGRKIMAAKETGNEVQWSSEVNYHFRLSAFRERLLAFYERNPLWITPASRMDMVAADVKAGLNDLSISRPRDRLSWAIPVPTDSAHSIYVWLDALLNYASKVGYPWPPDKQVASAWPADVHVIGKDIVRFHCIYWPALLMALDLPLPKRIMTHAHWTMDDKKMSKSTGNVVNPFWAVDRFGTDVMRFFLIHHGGLVDDANYDNSYIAGRYRNDLQAQLGNLVARVVQNRMYNPVTANQRYSGQFDILEQHCKECQIDVTDLQLFQNMTSKHPNMKNRRSINWILAEYCQMLVDLPKIVDRHFETMEPNRALHTIMSTIFAANALLQNYEPWRIYQQLKTPGEMSAEQRKLLSKRNECVFYMILETLRITGIMLQPFIPDKSAELLDMLRVLPERRSFSYTDLCSDDSYGRAYADGSRLAILFPPLVTVD